MIFFIKLQVLRAGRGVVKWEQSSGGADVRNALAAGKSADGEILFIGRVYHENTLTVGKVHPSHGVCYVPYDGEELSFGAYEILVTAKSRHCHKYHHGHGHGHFIGRHRRCRREGQRRRRGGHALASGSGDSSSSSSSSDSE